MKPLTCELQCFCVTIRYPFIRLCRPLLDCPSNLNEAIDWILRVTRKDGQGGDSNSAISKLSVQVQNLLTEVKDFGPGLSTHDFKKIKEALSTSGSGNGLITKLADGLQRFIGYEDRKNGLIRLAGIGRANDPLERLRDAVLGFWLGALSQVSGLLRSKQEDKRKVDAVIGKIYKGFGGGSKGVNDVVSAVAGLSSTVKAQEVQGVDKILEALKVGISDLKTNLSSSELKTLGENVEKYLKAVLENVKGNAGTANSEVSTLATQLPAVVNKLKSQTNKPIDLGDSGIKTQLDAVNGNQNGSNTQLGNLIKKGEIGDAKAKNIVNAVWYATSYFVDVLKTAYTSSYPSTSTWQSVGGNQATCAKIFLACLPLIFNGLSYLYWKFSHEHGWKTMTLGSPEPKVFMGIMTDKSRLFNGNKSATEIVSTAFQKFKEFNSATSNGSTTSYVDFLRNFKNKSLTTWQQGSSTTAANDNFLSGLYLCSTSYFSHQHQKRAASARPPSSIREMLYWLMGLTATPQFGDLLKHIHNVIGSDFRVAVSGSSRNDDTLTADQVTSYILSTCYTSPSVLNVIQGSVPPKESNDEPWLYDLYSNAAFPFKYPSSGAALFYALADYTYALQFQLSFLYKQCEYSYDNGCGWFYCGYGSEILPNGSGSAVTSHLCEGFKCGEKHLTCKHDGTNGGQSTEACKHDQDGLGQKCGTGGNNSPLQAFLTDKLNGLCRKHPGISSHLAVCSGSLCHVPMGFTADNLRNSSTLKVQGGHILNALKPFCGSSTTPLRQLCGTLTCLSKRVPKSLGELFGFYWQVTEQLFSGVKKEDRDPTSSLTGAISTLFQKLTTIESNLLYNTLSDNVKSIGSHFFGLSWHCHRKRDWKTVTRSSGGTYCNDHTNSKKACDLMSLYDSECTENSATCGKYLEPLGISFGATFANNYAFAYLSWAAYLTDDLYESLQEFLDTFNDLKCTGCKNNCNSHSSRSHGSQNSCHCRSVVECSDVLPHLYASGFSFHNAHWLRGRTYEKQEKKWSTDDRLRTCASFHSQLQSVISGNPLSNLLTSIDTFLFQFRYYFLSNLSGFWTIYTGLILYTFFFLLDTLHLRSHLKLTSSHTVPPLALLTSGKPLPLTKLTYIGQ
ncbi:variant erythrocyte surface antigen-1 family protein [Babesia caballi]|uniref:Variant erythrocyte surface antigen-1 family protein n=1 Tax=Babesia caballi TaxID=5871 RepID=A0AAV4LSG5_BABCB|nr:variant erythrocyte surface antigen-1 family protein [Babesia caballi]